MEGTKSTDHIPIDNGCSYYEWNRDVNLGPAHNSAPIPKEDQVIYNYYDSLQRILYETNYPETEDRTHVPRPDQPNSGTTIVVLASPVDCMAILLEGARSCPGDMLLVMSTTWISVEESDRDNSMKTMYVHKAITFDRGGKTYLDVFNTPRRVTYFMNFFTRALARGQRNDGEDLEKDLDCPTSSSLNLIRRTDDKVLTRIQMAEAGVMYPDTLAFCYKVPYDYIVPEGANIEVQKLNKNTGVEDIDDVVSCYLKRLDDECLRVGVKPAGDKWKGSQGLAFHDKKDLDEISRAVVELLSQLDPGDSVLVEEVHDPPTSGVGIKELDDLSFKIRVIVCRGPDDYPTATSYVCGVGSTDTPINDANTKPQSLETTMRQFGLANETAKVKKLLKEGSENLLRQIVEQENRLSTDEKGNIGAQTDVIGIDYILNMRNGVYVPIAIDVNSHNCIRDCHRYESMNPNLAGHSISPLVQTMCERSQKYAMWGKVVAVIGSFLDKKKFVCSAADKDNIRVVFIDNMPEDTVSDVTKHLKYDYNDHTQDETHAQNIVEMLLESDIKLDGCCTFWEDTVVLAALICDILNLSGIGVHGARNAKNKSATQNTLCDRSADLPHFPRACLYAERCYHIGNESDIDNAAKNVKFPAFMKLEYASGAVGSNPGLGLAHGNSMLIMKYIEGTEHDVEVILYKRKLVAAFVCDTGPRRYGNYSETTACMPSCLPDDKIGQIVTAAYQCCTEIGLVTGEFDVGFKMTPTGPKLIEINARMGGFYTRDWIKKIFGIDIVRCIFMVACGVKPLIHKLKPRIQMMGVNCVPSVHGTIFTDVRTRDQIRNLHRMGHIYYNAICEDFKNLDPDTNILICTIGVNAVDVTQAKRKLLEVSTHLNLTTDDFNVEYLLKDFV